VKENGKIRRLQLGTSRLEHLKPSALEFFLDPSWIHLCEASPDGGGLGGLSFSRMQEALARHSVPYLMRAAAGALREHVAKAIHEAPRSSIRGRTHALEFFYRKGGALPFQPGSIEFLFSEHFFEHLFLDEAIELFRECRRVLAPHGVIRTCVPDADLRTYAPPEPPGFPDRKLPFDDPAKHKTRWSVYSLSEALSLAGFRPLPLRFCDRLGRYVRRDPKEFEEAYAHSPDREIVYDLRYVMRINSLIVDGIRSD